MDEVVRSQRVKSVDTTGPEQCRANHWSQQGSRQGEVDESDERGQHGQAHRRPFQQVVQKTPLQAVTERVDAGLRSQLAQRSEVRSAVRPAKIHARHAHDWRKRAERYHAPHQVRREPLIPLDAPRLSLPLHVTLIGSNSHFLTSFWRNGCSSGLRYADHESDALGPAPPQSAGSKKIRWRRSAQSTSRVPAIPVEITLLRI